MGTSSAKQNAEEEQGAMPVFDPVKLGHIMMDVMERSRPLWQEAITNYSENADHYQPPKAMQEAYTKFWQALMADPQKLAQMQMDYWAGWGRLWQSTAQKLAGEDTGDPFIPGKGDKRFKDPAWQESLLFDYIKQSYLMTAEWMHKAAQEADHLDPQTQAAIEFYTKQFADAMAPTNFILTNPEVLEETIKTGGENLIRGLQNLLEDIERGGGSLKISTTDYDAFELGKNVATTPGRVVYQNDLMQLIQYAPTTQKVHKTPLLIVPPWINKYYILDLREDNSLVKWLVDQGHTVFMVSWVNPGPELSDMNFADYMQEGILDALDQIESITKQPSANVIGYCIGGTLLTMTLAYLAANKQSDKIASATLLTTLIDFDDPGELKLFTSKSELAELQNTMLEHGVLKAENLQKTFSLLRANDLIWSFVVNNYLMGKEPFPFDLLYWNDDSTNMPAALHSFYLENMYQDNLLIQPGAIELGDTPIDITKIKTPCYFLSASEDHIAPWKATYEGAQHIGGPKTFTLAASGHIAGVVNPPAADKYCFWTTSPPIPPASGGEKKGHAKNPPPSTGGQGGEQLPKNPDEWLKGAKEEKGSWWPHWNAWIKDYAGPKTTPARKPAKGLEPAPGSYVKVKST